MPSPRKLFQWNRCYTPAMVKPSACAVGLNDRFPRLFDRYIELESTTIDGLLRTEIINFTPPTRLPVVRTLCTICAKAQNCGCTHFSYITSKRTFPRCSSAANTRNTAALSSRLNPSVSMASSVTENSCDNDGFTVKRERWM